MKRVLWVFGGGLALSLTALLSGCGSDPETPGTGPGGTSSSNGSTSSNSSGGGNTGSSSSGTISSSSGNTGGGGGGGGGSSTSTSSSGSGGASSSSGSSSSGGPGPCNTDADCNNGLFCDGVETCNAGMCQGGAAPSCDDGASCTADSCDEAAKACAHAPNDAMCSDNTFCNGPEVCDPQNGAPGTGCAASVGFSCDDGLGCTIDLCDEINDKCNHAANDAACNNNISCDGVEVCSLMLGCISVNPPSCDDGVPCTNDFCDLVADKCSHVADDSKCQNGMFCDGVETCDAAMGCKAGTAVQCNDGIPCTVDACSEAVKGCLFAGNDAACDDGVFCNGAEICMAGQGCAAGIPLTCDDNRSCTADSCNEAQKQCDHVPNNAVCDNGLACDGTEICSANGPQPTGCMIGAPFPCPSDGIACTVEVCNEATDACEHLANNQLCSAGLECNVVLGGCVPPPTCFTNADCADGNLCDGMEACVNGMCVNGMPIDCDDGYTCTTDACDPGTGQCSHIAENSFCNDPFACNGTETCNPAMSPDMTGCVPGQAVMCNDNIDCTMDACQEPSGTCFFQPQNFVCSDGQLCNGIETCDPANSPNASGCAAGTPTVCPDDGIACTTTTCDPMLNACVTTANNALCPCGQTCDPAQGGCGSFCQISTCQGKVYACGDCIDNDGDCKIDSADDQCLGPCDNTEESFYGGIPGQNNSPCKSDCYFDQDTGSGNDDCYWSHKCDPLEVGPNYPPEGSQCSYNPNANIPGYNGSCSTAFAMQSQTCTSYCGPLTPNGCDCFGCCVIPGAPTTVWLGSENPAGTGSCNINTVNDPTMCKPCTQVAACINTCEECEVCIGKPDLPPQCNQQECDPGVQLCGQAGQAPCPFGFTCITGCCILNP